jgi:cytochrome c oxidase subunit 4
MSGANESTWRLWLRPSLVWLALLVLLGITVGSAYIPLGAGNGIINYGIAAAKVALVLIFFMHLDRSRALIRLAALSGVFWVLFMFSLSFGDYLTRDWNGSATTLEPTQSQMGARERGTYPRERLPLVPRFGHRD